MGRHADRQIGEAPERLEIGGQFGRGRGHDRQFEMAVDDGPAMPRAVAVRQPVRMVAVGARSASRGPARGVPAAAPPGAVIPLGRGARRWGRRGRRGHGLPMPAPSTARPSVASMIGPMPVRRFFG